MRQLIAGAAVTAGAAAAWGLWRGLRNGSPPDEQDRWLAVTVNAPVDAVKSDERLRKVLAASGKKLELRVTPAPGDRGTEIAVRLLDTAPPWAFTIASRIAGRDPRQPVRQALRDAKSLLETGETLQLDETAGRGGGIGTKIMEVAGRRAGGEGRL
ncbi:hypothetical protein [Glycomyces tarimensis]